MPRFGARLPAWIRLFPALLLFALSIPVAAPALADNGPDYAISGGWFYTETGGGNGNGYAVRDAGTDANGHTIKFWSEFQRLGGVAMLGYPVAEPYVGSDGFTYQPFQRGVLQWRAEIQSAYLSNVFQQLQTQDAWLQSTKGIPPEIANDGSNGNYAQAVTTRLSWLTNDAIKSFYLANPNPSAINSWSQDAAIQLYGLPMSAPQQEGPFITQRFQRFAIQLWTNNVPGMPAPGTVVGVLGGDLFKQAGQLPASAVQPISASAAASALPIAASTPAPAPQPTATPAPAPAASGNYSWYVASQQGYPNCGTTYIGVWTQDANGNNVYGLTIKSWNDWGNVYNTASTQNNGSNASWTRLIGPGVRAGTWYVEIIDGSGNQASDVATVNMTGSCAPNAGNVQQADIIFKEH